MDTAQPRKDKSFSYFVKQHLPIRPDKNFANEWDHIIAPTIVKNTLTCSAILTMKLTSYSYVSNMMSNTWLLLICYTNNITCSIIVDGNLNKNQGRTKKDDEISEEDNDFEYDSDPKYDTIHFSNWNMKNDVDKLMERRTVNIHSNVDDDNDNDDNGNDDDSVSEQSSVYSLNAIQEEMEREAMSADMRSRGKRSRVINEETNTACKEMIQHTNRQTTGRTARVTMG